MVALRSFLVAVVMLGLAGRAVAYTARFEIDEAVARADVIAIVSITADRERWRFLFFKGPAADYKWKATAVVLVPLKGCIKGGEYELLHHSDLTCPNVMYTVGEDYLVFLIKSPTGYRTMNASLGQFLVERGKVRNFYPMQRAGDKTPPTVATEQAVSFLKRKLR